MATQPAAKKSSFTVSRLLLLLILAGALVALGYDQYAKYQMGQAYNTVEKLNDKNEAENILGLSKKEIHEKLGREPTNAFPSSTGFQDIEEYDFPGVFYVYRVSIKYRKGIDMYDRHDKESIFRISGK
jgi:hypothetical protein